MLFSILLSLQTAHAQTGEEIMQLVLQNQNWSSISQDISLHIENNKGTKDMELHSNIRVENQDIYAFTQFTAPKEIANTKVVLIDKHSADDQLLLYLPALHRVTTLNDKNSDRAFMGSDFQFSDLILTSSTQQHSLEEDNAESWKIQTTDAAQQEYTHWTSIVDKTMLLPTDVTYYKGETPIKRQILLSSQMIEEKHYPKEIRMENLQKHSSTTMKISNVQKNVDVPMSLFTAESLIEQ